MVTQNHRKTNKMTNTQNEREDERIPKILRDSCSSSFLFHEAKNAYMTDMMYKGLKTPPEDQLPRAIIFDCPEEECYRESLREFYRTIIADKGDPDRVSMRPNPIISQAVREARKKLSGELRENGIERPLLKLDFLSGEYIAEQCGKLKPYPESCLTIGNPISLKMQPIIEEFNGLIAQVREMQDPSKVDVDRLDNLKLEIGKRVNSLTERNSAVRFYELFDQHQRPPTFEELERYITQEQPQ